MSNEMLASTDDTITRYIFSKSDFNSASAVKASAFKPPNDYPNEISVCIITGLSEEEIWDIAQKIRNDRAVIARADIKVSDIICINDEQGSYLQVLIDGEPIPEHANIRSIPIPQEFRRIVTTHIAQKAKLYIKT